MDWLKRQLDAVMQAESDPLGAFQRRYLDTLVRHWRTRRDRRPVFIADGVVGYKENVFGEEVVTELVKVEIGESGSVEIHLLREWADRGGKPRSATTTRSVAAMGEYLLFFLEPHVMDAPIQPE